MVDEKLKVYLIENDHRFEEYCNEKGFSPNNVPMDDFIRVAEDIGWVMTPQEFEMHHNTNTLPEYYYIRMYTPC